MTKVDDRPQRFDHNPATSSPFDAARFESSLDAVLTDREALDCFRAWILGDPMRTADALDLYFAIQGYKQAIERNDPNSLPIASQLHRRFVSLKTGSCDFIWNNVRVETSNKVHRYVAGSQMPPINLFDGVLPYVKNFLTQQHALFVSSNDFKDLVCRYSNGFGQIPPNDEQDGGTEHCYVNEETFEDMGIRHPTTLASSSVVGSSVVDDDAQQASTSLSKPSHHRSRNNLHESLCLLKISPTSAAQTMTRSESHPGGGRKMKSSKLEPTSSSDDPQLGQHREKRHRSRVGRGHSAMKEKPHGHSGMPHERPEQRVEFANILTEKLNVIAEEIARLERQHGVIVYARQIPEYQQREQGFTAQPISVPYMNPALQNPTMVSDTLWQPGNMYPSAFAPPPVMATSVPPLSMAATSGYDAYDEDDEDLTKYEQKLRKQNNRIDRSNSISPAPLHGTKASRFFSPYGNGGFAPPPPATSSKMNSTVPPVAQHCYPPFQHGAPFSYTNATSNGYLPQSSAMSFLSYSDSSGVFSAESAHVNLNSQHVDQGKMKRLYEKARETNAAQSAMSTNVNPNGHSVGNSQTLMRTNKQSSSNAAGNSHQSGSQTLPRPTRPTTTDTTMSKMTVSLREPGQMAFVSKCERKPLTFREFRRLFGISSNTTKRFFFKSPPDDDDDDLYQWTAVDRDDELVPIFEGKVTAECRTMPDSD
uniref:RGS domain-containing protein n=1 Tax=Panagrellus redivivus TaxID=6233 RepID=A0A7E4VWL9_PANRE